MAEAPHLAVRLAGALGRGDLAEVAALVDLGADLLARDRHGYGAALHAVYSRDLVDDPGLIGLLRYLLARGVDPDAASRHGETPIRRLASTGRFDAVRVLLDAGADAGPLGWTPLHRAAALGSPSDVRSLVEAGADLEARDCAGCTPFLVAALGGRLDIAEALVAAGSDPAAIGSGGHSAVALAVAGGHSTMIRRLLTWGVDPDAADAHGQTPIETAAVEGRSSCVEVLVACGVGVAAKPEILRGVEDGATIRRLLDAGADPAALSHQGRRELLGWGPPDVRWLKGIDARAFDAGWRRVYGRTNPEILDIPFQKAMLRSGIGASHAQERFSRFSVAPVWTADRFGQSVTVLADGRTILVGGEHEDWYDPNFCIYNDVIVAGPGDAITILGYPQETFPPTDFHTATPVGERLWIIGSLGYNGFRRHGMTPVHALDLRSLRMERIEPSGPSPGWIFGHRADLVGPTAIRVSAGQRATDNGSGGSLIDPNESAWILDLSSLRWSPDPERSP